MYYVGVLLVNMVLLALTCQSLARSNELRESCDTPLVFWIIIQSLLVLSIQVIPVILVPLLRETIYEGTAKSTGVSNIHI